MTAIGAARPVGPPSMDHHFVADGRARLNAVRSGQANLALIDPRQIAEARAPGFKCRSTKRTAPGISI